MTRSMNGRALPPAGREMQAIAAWIRFLGQGVPAADAATGRGVPPLPLLERAADPRRGARVYELQCIGCHQADGQGARRGGTGDATGYYFPPLWGPDSYNDGAGMARVGTFAAFVHANMPLGVTYRDPALSAEDAWDVAAYVNSRSHPAKAGLEADFPDRWRKPVDAPYGPWADPFPAEQHKYGPWQPIQAWIKANAPR